MTAIHHDPSSLRTAQPKLVAAIAATRPLLVRQAQRMMRDRDSAEDAAQDALVAALTNLQRFRGDAKLGTWIYRIGANTVLMSLRRQRRADARTKRAEGQLPREESWLHGEHKTLSQQQLSEALHKASLLRWAIAELPERYRTVVTACDLNELPISTVASSLGITVGGVRTRRLRAIRMLQARLRLIQHRGDL